LLLARRHARSEGRRRRGLWKTLAS
jgi:hypothetical protein